MSRGLGRIDLRKTPGTSISNVPEFSTIEYDFLSLAMKLTGLTPNLITHDVARSVAFYRDVLGFRIVQTVPDAAPFVFVWLERDDVKVFVNDAKAVLADAPDAHDFVVGKSGVSMFITMEDIDALWDAVKDQATVVMPIKDQWYGMREFAVTDPDGYVVTFAERKGS
jgi:uncharacterized glyoxalase superfamily protein PhnB